jgi:hypothetical protein
MLLLEWSFYRRFPQGVGFFVAVNRFLDAQCSLRCYQRLCLEAFTLIFSVRYNLNRLG